jgi:hypothetical protein
MTRRLSSETVEIEYAPESNSRRVNTAIAQVEVLAEIGEGASWRDNIVRRRVSIAVIQVEVRAEIGGDTSWRDDIVRRRANDIVTMLEWGPPVTVIVSAQYILRLHSRKRRLA